MVLFMPTFKMNLSKLEYYKNMFLGEEFNIIRSPKLVTDIPQIMHCEII